jgi:hypothetical protein
MAKTTSDEAKTTASPSAERTVDVQKLADKVYRLMLADLRREQASHPVRQRRKRTS